ncbi:MAG: stage II sporulation protein M [Anaerolineae bacterium]|nr:stage II sporulation protein M [Anaerolineae bacterium]
MTTVINTRGEVSGFQPPALVLPKHTFGETMRNALVVTRREMRDSLRDWRIMAPIIVLTLVFPLLAQGMTGLFTSFFVSNGAAPLVENFLPLLPMIIGFFPVSISLVIALETFVGEKERRSLEPLLSTPLTNTELYLGKTFAAMIPPLIASYLGIGIYLGGLILGSQQWRPEPWLIIQILLLTTTQALVMVTGAVVVSSQTTSTRASNLLASFIIIPTSMLVMLESFIMITNNRYVLWYLLGGLFVLDILLFSMGARIFNREELLGRSIDEINLRWAWRQFKHQFIGGEKVTNIATWYRYSVFPALGKLRTPMIIVLLSIIGVFIFGFVIATVRPDFQLPNAGTAEHEQSLESFKVLYQYGGHPGTVLAVVWQNARILIAGLILAVFTFGVLAIILAAAPFGILGFLLGQPVVAALGTGTFFLAVFPHSILEIPAILIATAASARLGLVTTRPPEGMGVWDAWLLALADAIKVFIGVVLPMLFLAALIEVYITPLIVIKSMGG